ncbi:TMV resistance protein N [Vitis vinifera]|uniref:TMV resistance protein N n=1 Tax=Vitis vinifera TaxID=29760 RepID=A0A438HWP7_VITVI|nr:TMV resistance protein N [Vitis vinifera]
MLEREIFFNGEDLDFVQRILDACHSFAKLIMQELDDKSLISILDKKLSMHDLMQKAGWEIVRRQNHNEPGKWSRLWDPDNVHHVLTKNTLRYLHWDGWTLESLPSNFDGKKLVGLSLKHSSIKQLWKEHKCLPKLEVINLVTKLKRLTILNMKNCKMLHHFPSITGLESLKVLNLSGCSKLDKFPEIQGYMECLVELNLEGTAIVELPFSVVFLPRLVLLDMQNCKNLTILPSNIYSLKFLGTLVLSGCSGLERFPEIMESLSLRKCKNLKSLPNSICSLRSLETLIVSGCSKLSKLPEELGRLQFLMKLQVDGTAITQPPLSLFLLRNLRELSFRDVKDQHLTPRFHPFYSDLSGCNLTDRSINDNLGHLRFLEELNLSRNNLVTIPEEVNRLSHLRVLSVNQCKRLREISKLPPSIKLLDAGDCISLESLSVLSPQSPQYLSSSSRLHPVTFKLTNCFALAQDNVATILEKLHQNFLPEIEYSIVLPGSTIPEWFQHPSIGSSVTIELPRNWHNEEFLGFALCSPSLGHSGDRVVETDHIWLVYQPGAKLMIPKSSSLNKFRKITAYFSLSGASHVVKTVESILYTPEETQPKRLRGGENCEEGSHA